MKILNACPFHLSDDKIRILWEVTPKCNMYCKHCLFFQNTQKGIAKELSTKQMYKIIENVAKDKSVNAIWLSRWRASFKEGYCRYLSKNF